VAAASPSPAQASPVPAVLDTTARKLVAALDVSGCAISRVVGDLLVDIAAHSRDEERLFLGYGYLISEYPLTREVLESRAPRALTVNDPGADEREAAVLRALGFDALLMLPLLVGESPWALVELFAKAERRFEPSEVGAAEAILRETGAQLERLAA
jgi:hypothetical protein